MFPAKEGLELFVRPLNFRVQSGRAPCPGDHLRRTTMRLTAGVLYFDFRVDRMGICHRLVIWM